jgi:hypothetical protein
MAITKRRLFFADGVADLLAGTGARRPKGSTGPPEGRSAWATSPRSGARHEKMYRHSTWNRSSPFLDGFRRLVDGRADEAYGFAVTSVKQTIALIDQSSPSLQRTSIAPPWS